MHSYPVSIGANAGATVHYDRRNARVPRRYAGGGARREVAGRRDGQALSSEHDAVICA